MSAVVPLQRRRAATAPAPAPRIALLGTGGVGTAFVARCAEVRARGVELPAFAWLSNSRVLLDAQADPATALRQAREAGRPRGQALPPWAEAESLARGDVIVDATASDIVADRHADWLGRGIHVVTANKLGLGTARVRADAIEAASVSGGGRYGDAATVGAGLPLLRTLRALVAGGERIDAVEGVLSGSLGWLFDQYDGVRPFSAFVEEARIAGLTEPDPRDDLSGEDVRRKLLILARAAGHPLEAHHVRVDPLVAVTTRDLAALDAPLREQFDTARRAGCRLRFVARLDAGGASVGLRILPATHPLCGGSGSDNRVAITSERYPATQPLVIQGPGAGADVTAGALLDDVVAILQGPPAP